MATHELRSCPTRTDGADVLFAHKVTLGHCQDRQRNRYHKCFTCAFNNARVALHGPPLAAPPPEVERPAPAAQGPVTDAATPEVAGLPDPLVAKVVEVG